MTSRAWKKIVVGCLVMAQSWAACSDDDDGAGPSAGKGGAGGMDAVQAAASGAPAAGSKAQGGAKSQAPTEYPADWEVMFTDARPLPADYQFGHKTETLKAGTTYGAQKLALQCDVSWERDIEVKLRDGTTIYLDLLGPTEPKSKLPALVAWSPYGKTFPGMPPASVPPDAFSGVAKFEGPDAAFWVCKDYVLVHVDVRGAYKSEGKVQSFGRVDAADGYDVIEWIAAQSWSNGSVGLHGASWLSMATWNIAATRPPHLKAIAPWNGQTDMYRNSLVQGGIPDTAFSSMVGGILVSGQGVESTVQMLDRYPLWSDYWADKRFKVEDITAPAYVGADIASGLHTAGTLDGFRRLGSKEKWLRVNDTHEWYDEYSRDNEEDLQRFFDHYLKGVDNDWTQTPQVRVAVMDPGDGGKTKLRTPYEAWPLPDTEYRKLYLDAKGALTAEMPTSADKVSYDAKSGQTSFTLRFDADTQLVGYLKAHLYVEAEGADDLDVFVLVEKLDQAGTPLVPSEIAQMYFPKPAPGVPGRLRASQRKLDKDKSTDYLPVHAFNESQKLKAGEVVALDVALLPTAMRWHKGQQLKLTIAGSYVKGSGLPLTTLNEGTHNVHFGADHASYLQVPVVSFTK